MKKTYSIAFVSNSSWYLYNLRLGIMKYFQSKGYEVYTIAPRDEFTHFLLLEGFHHIDIDTSNKSISLFESWSLFFQLFKIYRKLPLSLIFHYTVKPNTIGVLAARLARKKTISVVSGAGFTFLKKNLLNSLTVFLYKLATRFTESIWFVNQDDRKEFMELGICTEKNSELLPGEGINPTHFAPRPEPENKTFKFLYSGRLIWDKGIEEYVLAARLVKKKMPNVQFDVLGFLDVSNPHMISSEKIHLWQKEGVIHYLGKTKDVRPYLADCNCVVLPSYYREGTPRSLLEASSMARPIITTDNIGCREVVIDHYNGLLVNVKDHLDLADKMIEMVQLNSIEREIMGWNGRKLIEEKFDEKYLLSFYRKSVDQYTHKFPLNKRKTFSSLN